MMLAPPVYDGSGRRVMGSVAKTPAPQPAQPGGLYGLLNQADDALKYYAGPHVYGAAQKLGSVASMLSPASDVIDAGQNYQGAIESARSGDVPGAVAQTGYGLLSNMGLSEVSKPVAAIFAGVGAKTADLAKLKMAEEAEQSGADATKIWNETGWFRGADGKWRFEIDDLPSEVSPRVTEEFNRREIGDQVPVQNADGFLEHPELFAAYPDLWRVNTRLTKGGGYPYQPSGQYFVRESGAENIGVDAKTLPQAKSLTLHELQHAIQQREGFAPGADLHEVGMDEYTRSAGEVEANNVQRRLWMNAQERKKSPPFVTEQENVPRDRQIVRFGLLQK